MLANKWFEMVENWALLISLSYSSLLKLNLSVLSLSVFLVQREISSKMLIIAFYLRILLVCDSNPDLLS